MGTKKTLETPLLAFVLVDELLQRVPVWEMEAKRAPFKALVKEHLLALGALPEFSDYESAVEALLPELITLTGVNEFPDPLYPTHLTDEEST